MLYKHNIVKLKTLHEGLPTRRDILKKAAVGAAGGAAASSYIGPEIAKMVSGNKPEHIEQSKDSKAFKYKAEESSSHVVSPKNSHPIINIDIDKFARRLQKYEGNTAYAHKVGNTREIDIGMGHVMYHPHHPNPTARSRSVFNKLFGDSVNFDKIIRGKDKLSSKQLAILNAYEIKEHIKRAKSRFPHFDLYPDEAQFAILDAIYRGDMGPKTTKLINSGRYKAAAVEYLNHEGYRTAISRGMSGIRKRMQNNRDGLLSLIDWSKDEAM